MLRSPGNGKRVIRFLGGFEPEAILTVAHGFSWLAASEFAHEMGLPLHLIVHDHWPGTAFVFDRLLSWQQRQFGHAYRMAASRLCVSPSMEEEYRRLYRVPGQLLYPSRAKNSSPHSVLPATYTKETGPLTGAYAGNIFHDGYARMIASLSTSLERRGGRLLLFGPHSPERLERWGLNRPMCCLRAC